MDPDLLLIFGFVFAIAIGSQLISLAKKWIDRNKNSYDEQAFDRLAKAFIQHKKESERRFQNLEAIVTDDEPKSSSKSSDRKLEESQLHNTIEIDADEHSEKKHDNSKESSGGNLRNMLKE